MLLTATFVRISNKVFMGAPLFIIGTRNLYLPQFTFDHSFNDPLELTSSDIISEQFGILCCPCYARSHSPMPNTSHSNGSSQLFPPLRKGRELSKVKLINACFSFSPFLHIEQCVLYDIVYFRLSLSTSPAIYFLRKSLHAFPLANIIAILSCLLCFDMPCSHPLLMFHCTFLRPCQVFVTFGEKKFTP